jgi:hypothetical protein
VQNQCRGLADDAGVRGQRVAHDDQQDVGDGERDGIAATHGMPAGQPVGADSVLEERQARHQGEQHSARVSGEQPRDAARVGDPASRAYHGGRVDPPQAEHSGGPRGDQQLGEERYGVSGSRGGVPLRAVGAAGVIRGDHGSPLVAGSSVPVAGRAVGADPTLAAALLNPL